jgi:hypothetical protein
VVLNITLVIAILGYFGVQTTSFAALLAGAGLAIGTAWGGLLSNFAAGIFLVRRDPPWLDHLEQGCRYDGPPGLHSIEIELVDHSPSCLPVRAFSRSF